MFSLRVFFKFQDGLYERLKDSVSTFRELVGAPDTPRWNSVLFGGLLQNDLPFLKYKSDNGVQKTPRTYPSDLRPGAKMVSSLNPLLFKFFSVGQL